MSADKWLNVPRQSLEWVRVKKSKPCGANEYIDVLKQDEHTVEKNRCGLVPELFSQIASRKNQENK